MDSNTHTFEVKKLVSEPDAGLSSVQEEDEEASPMKSGKSKQKTFANRKE